jgi:diaminohydroxyphosphoribosylaminopyrimidine deaminase/5-amino-6-(5-phosphoribosylamino)uracil reductase
MWDAFPEIDQQFLRRAIRLAMNGRGFVEPNPMVACVLVKGGRVVGEGYHARFGGPHAEPTALANCTESPAGATAYVTLEPCCHTNKKTPPCAPRLIEAKVARVVIGCLDPNPDVNGKGVAMLRAAGIRVDCPALEGPAKQLIAPFIARTTLGRPYVTVKWAQSRNGRVAGPMGRRVKITNDASDGVVHALRARCDAIAVGTNTALNDDPLLTARPRGAPDVPRRQPLRLVLSNTLKLQPEAKLFRSARETPVVVYCSASSADANRAVVERLRDLGVEVTPLPDRESRFSFADVLRDLHARGVMHLLVEPGPTLTRYFLARGQADRVWVFRSPRDLDEAGEPAISAAPLVDYSATGTLDLAGDVLTEYLNPGADAYFASEPSADLVLAGGLSEAGAAAAAAPGDGGGSAPGA